MAAVNSLPMITLIYPSDLMKHSTLFHANVFQFEYQDFEVQFELQEDDTSGLSYFSTLLVRHGSTKGFILERKGIPTCS
jgi:hypothetical protein